MIDITELKKLHKDLTQKIQTQQETTIKVKFFEVKQKVYLRIDNIKIK